MPIHDIQPAFTVGEVAPDVYQRIDSDKWKYGLRTAKNMFPTVQGPIKNRAGTYYVGNAKYNNKKSRLVEFVFSESITFVLEFGDGYIRFFNESGRVLVSSASVWGQHKAYVVGDFATNNGIKYYCIVAHTSGTVFATDLAAGKWVAQDVYEIPTTYTEDEVFDLKFTQSADTLFIAHKNHPLSTLVRVGSHTQGDVIIGQYWRFGVYELIDGPYQPMNTNETFTLWPGQTTGNVTVVSSSNYFTTFYAPIGSLIKIIQPVDGSKVSEALSSATNSSWCRVGGRATWRLITHGTWSAKFDLEISYDNGATWYTRRSFSGAADINHDTYGVEDLDSPYYLRISVKTYTSGTLNIDLTSDAYENTGIIKVTGIAPGQPTVFYGVVVKELGNNKKTSDWQVSVFNPSGGGAATVAFFQDRLVLANAELNENAIWMSKTGAYNDFGRSTPLVDSDGITINIPSRRLNGVKNLVSLGALLALTSDAEISVGAVSGDAISPSSVFTKSHSNRGSCGIDPVIVGDRVVFVQRGYTQVRDLGYQFQADSYVGREISLTARHLLDGYTIVDVAYQQEPDSIIWFVRSDGKLIACTYVPEQEFLSWSIHETDGLVKSIACINTQGGDEVYMSVERDGVVMIEKMATRVDAESGFDWHYVDSGVRYSGTPVSTITGLSHLEGRTVSVLADGFVIPNKVVTGGAVALGGDYSVVHVGLPYESVLDTIGYNLPMPDGTSQGRKYHIARIQFFFVRSRGGWCGMDDTHIQEIISKDAQGDLSQAEPLHTGWSRENLRQNDDPYGHVLYKQVDPLPVTIASIVSIVDPGQN